MTSLAVRSLESGYGEVQILWGASVELGAGKLTTILGSNGAGKTTLLRTIVGLLPAWKGNVLLDDRDVTRLSPHEKAELGLVLVPEGRQLFHADSSREPRNGIDTQARPRHDARDHRSGIRALPASRGAANTACGHALRRRAADARDRTRSHLQTE